MLIFTFNIPSSSALNNARILWEGDFDNGSLKSKYCLYVCPSVSLPLTTDDLMMPSLW